jgi:prepilin-type N-terminal cleavage/methylation domain-containing protein
MEVGMNKSAFTLLEVMVSVLILSMAVAGNFALLVTAKGFQTNAEHRYQAVCQAQTVVDKLRYYVSSDPSIALVDDPNHLVQDAGISDTLSISNVVNKNWGYKVDTVGATGGKDVTVKVSWEEI